MRDFIRTCYVGRMRTVQGAPPADVAWFFVPRDTPHSPDNVYQSLDSDQPFANDGIGEQRERAHAGRWNKCAPYLDGAQPYPLDGQHECGTDYTRLYGARPGIDPTFVTDCVGRCPDCTPPLFVGCIETGSREGGPVERLTAVVGVLHAGSREGGRIKSGFPLVSCVKTGDREGGPLASFPVPIHQVLSGSREGGPVERIPPHTVNAGSREGDALARRSPWRLAGGSREGDHLLVAGVARWIGGGSREGGPLDGHLAGPTPTYAGCGECPLTFITWNVSGVGTGSAWADLAHGADVTITSGCVWFGTYGVSSFTMQFNPGAPRVQFSYANFAVNAIYELTGLNCTGAMVLTLASSFGPGTAPATVNVVPVA